MSDSPEADLIRLFSLQRISNSLTVAASALWLYDYILTFKHEVRYIWKKKMGPFDYIIVNIRFWTTAMCILTTYNALSIFKPSDAQVSTPLLFTAACVIPMMADTIFAARIWALYQRNNYILSFLLFLIIGQGIVGIFFGIKFIVHSEVAIVANLPGCHFFDAMHTNDSALPISLSLAYLSNIATSIALFFFSIFILASFGRKMPLMKLFVRDGAAWFLSVLAIYLMQVLLTRFDPFFAGAMILPIVVNAAIASSRVLINMRSVGSASGATTQMSRPLQFAAPHDSARTVECA